MRTREKTYEDYGYTRDQANVLKTEARKTGFDTEIMVWNACWIANPEIADELFYAIRKNLSYDDVGRSRAIPINRNDWYAYTIKAICMFGDLLNHVS